MIINLVAPNAAAKVKLLLYKPASDAIAKVASNFCMSKIFNALVHKTHSVVPT
jgi:hypothetical protein